MVLRVGEGAGQGGGQQCGNCSGVQILQLQACLGLTPMTFFFFFFFSFSFSSRLKKEGDKQL